MTTLYHTLGYDDQQYRLKLEYDHDARQLHVTVDDQGEPWSRLREALEKQVLVYARNINGNYASRVPKQEDGNTLTFSGMPEDFEMRLNKEPIGRYHIDEHGELSQDTQRPLTAGEVRKVGTFHNGSPYSQAPEDRDHEENAALLQRAKKAVFTDFHTHSSGHITPEGLIKVARAHHSFYPIALLNDAGIDTSYRHLPKASRKSIPRIKFPPRETPGLPDAIEGYPLDALEEKDIAKLARKMAMPNDRQSTYSEMEYDAYRFRYPLTKLDDLLSDTLKQTAREMMAQGIRHADIAMVGLEKPELLNIMHQTMHQMEQSDEFKDFSMHFMVGIPRNYSLAKVEEMLEKTKILSQSPYITGVDFLGYEVNKTRNFTDLLGKFCDWANEYRPGFNVRMHAGENDKNLDNVKDFLDLAKAHPNLYFRVGHGVHGMDADTLKLARELSADPKDPHLTIEANPDSVLALNNVDSFRTLPYKKMVDHNIPFVIGSDSAGTYGTSAEQLGLAAYYGGLDNAGFDKLQDHQQHLMERQRGYSRKMADAIPEWGTAATTRELVDRLSRQLSKVPKAPEEKAAVVDEAEIIRKLDAQEVSYVKDLDKVAELKDRTPITIVGASGDRWQKIDPIAQRDIAIGMDMLFHALDSDKTYLVQGRIKETGLGVITNKALTNANADLARNGKDPFYSLGLMIAPNFTEVDSYKHLTHIHPVSDKFLELSENVVNHTLDNNGILIAAGGAAYTRDIITKADIKLELEKNDNKGTERALLLFENAKGASREKSKKLNPHYNISDGISLLEKLYKRNPSLFRDDFRIDRLQELYEQSAARVDRYGYDAPPDPTDQLIVDAASIDLKKQKGK